LRKFVEQYLDEFVLQIMRFIVPGSQLALLGDPCHGFVERTSNGNYLQDRKIKSDEPSNRLYYEHDSQDARYTNESVELTRREV
jgi:hypothetical protein